MKIYSLSPLQYSKNRDLAYKSGKETVCSASVQIKERPFISPKLVLVSFYGSKNPEDKNKKITPAKRLQTGDYKISKYIAEISKARYLHGDRAVVDLSMGNPDLTPPKNAKNALKDKVDDLWSHRYNNPKGDGYFFHTAAEWFKNDSE